VPAAHLASLAVLLVLALLIVPAPPAGEVGPTTRPTLLAPTNAVPSTTAPSAPSVPGPAGVADRIAALESSLRARGVPGVDIRPPDLAAEVPGASGRVRPSYAQGPAPMGVADLGLRNVSGTLQPYVYNTSSFWGSVNFTKAEPVYLDGDGPDTFTTQLNAVATDVTLAGKDGYEFWAQDFASYTWSTHVLSFGDNVWNFSSAAGRISSNVFAHHGPNGTLLLPVFYYAIGPTVEVPYPFVLNLYLNASVQDRQPTIFFNYSVTNRTGTVAAGEFDFVAFNSGLPASSTVPPPAFQVNGTGVDPVGLPNDVELVLVGSGNGDTTTFFRISATMSLERRSSTTGPYSAIPAAFNAGSDTGETSNGLLPIYHAPLLGGTPSVTLVTGPSFLEGLWNVSQAVDGARTVALNQRPQNAFLFVNPGSTFNASLAQWVPTLRLGAPLSDFELPNTGSYTLEWMLSDRTPLNHTVNATVLPNSTIPLLENMTPVAPTEGSYTPLLAWSNSELAAIATGNGSAAKPYVLIHRTAGPLNPVFGQLNDFGFPVFAGVWLANITDDVVVEEPAVAIDYGSWMDPLLTGLDLPTTNSLQLEFWNVSNVTVTNSSDLGGWLTVNLGFFPAGEVLFWGSSGNLLENSTFHDQGVGVALYGGSNNTIWGNTILASAGRASFDSGNATTGILEWESGDLLYNNFVAVPLPAVTPMFDAASCLTVCAVASYTDRWNVSLEPANATQRVLDATLTGSILRTWYQGGNYWSNYGTASNPYGVLPYNDSRRITVGGDYYPLTPSAVYSVTFDESGLLPGDLWTVTCLGVTTNSTTNASVVFLPNGTYNYSITGPSGFAPPPPGTITVNGTNQTVNVSFVELFAQRVDEVGLVSGWNWTVWYNVTARGPGRNASGSSTAGTFTLDVENGSYSVQAYAYGYSAVNGSATVDDRSLTHTVTFSLVPILTVIGTGLSSGAPWTVTVQQGSSTFSEARFGDGTIVFTVLELNPGAFTWSVSAPNYAANVSSGSGNTASPSEAFVGFSSTSSGLTYLEVVAGALAAAAALGFALYALERRRSRRPPPPIRPVATPPAATAATVVPVPAPPAPAPGPTPWEETSADEEKPSVPAPWEEVPSDSEHPAPYSKKG
jgi:thermopsin